MGNGLLLIKKGNTIASTDFKEIKRFNEHQAIAKNENDFVLIDEKGNIIKKISAIWRWI